MRIQLFIYGSLLPGLSNHHYIRQWAISMQPGRVRGRLVDCGPYPALVRDEKAERDGACVQGLWIELRRKALKTLDELEDFYGPEERNDYERIWTTDLEHPERAGYVYVWATGRGYPVIPGDCWRSYLNARDSALGHDPGWAERSQ